MTYRTIAGKAAVSIINGLQAGNSGDLTVWKHMNIADLPASTNAWIKIIDALYRNGWHEPKYNGVTYDENAVALTMYVYARSWSNNNNHPHNEDIRFGQALAAYHKSIKDYSNNDGVAMIKKIASASTFKQQSYLLARLVPKIATVSGFDYAELTDAIIDLQNDDRKNYVIIRWMKDFYSTINNNNKKEETK
jgi:CRISPR type I-E-associated protein CasB/Cse2